MPPLQLQGSTLEWGEVWKLFRHVTPQVFPEGGWCLCSSLLIGHESPSPVEETRNKDKAKTSRLCLFICFFVSFSSVSPSVCMN